jgi:DNA-binding CsgD family transcriptional regulator
MSPEHFDELLGKLYDAALAPKSWPVFLERFSDVFESLGTVVYLLDYADRQALSQSEDIPFLQQVRIDPGYILSYDRYYSSVNVWLENARDFPEGTPTTSCFLYPNAELPKTEWYNDWLRPQGYFYSLSGSLLELGSLSVRLTAFRSSAQPPFSPEDLQAYGRLMPHLRRACLIQRKFAELQGLQNAGAEVLHRLPMGVVLLDRSGRTVFLNKAAEAIARQADGFTLGKLGFCNAKSPNETQALRKLIADAIGGVRPCQSRRGGAMPLARRGSGRPLCALVSPLPGKLAAWLGCAPGAVLFLSDPDRQTEAAEELLARCYGLSPAEAKLAAALAAGQSVQEHMEERGVSHNTVKTQLKRILAKTGTRRQAELVKLLLSGPAMLGAAAKDPR